MGLKAWLKEFWNYYLKVTFVDPNSPEGLRHRAEKIEREFGKDNPMASALRKQAELKEEA